MEIRKRKRSVGTTVPEVGDELRHEAMVGDAVANNLPLPELGCSTCRYAVDGCGKCRRRRESWLAGWRSSSGREGKDGG